MAVEAEPPKTKTGGRCDDPVVALIIPTEDEEKETHHNDKDNERRGLKTPHYDEDKERRRRKAPHADAKTM